jgi:hypothetical protein
VHTFTADNSGPKIWDISLFFEKLPKESNRPIGKNSPNLVTMLASKLFPRNRIWLQTFDRKKMRKKSQNDDENLPKGKKVLAK